MKKIPFITFALGSIFIASIALTAISYLSNLITKPEGLNIYTLAQGQLFQLLRVGDFWSQYPSLPPARLLLAPNALLVMALLLGGVFYELTRRNIHPVLISLALMLTALIPYGIGWMALAKNINPQTAGNWLAFMLAGVLYAASACAMFSGAQLLRKPIQVNVP